MNSMSQSRAGVVEGVGVLVVVTDGVIVDVGV